jgi:hypothetical protein
MMADKSRTEIDTELLQELRRRAQEQGRPEGELLEEAVRRYLERPGSLSELFERIARGRAHSTRAAGARRRAAVG